MNKQQLKAELIAHINQSSISSILILLAEITDEASKQNPNYGYTNDGRLIRSIVTKIEN